MSLLANNLARLLVLKGNIPEAKLDVFSYGLELIISHMLTFVTIIVSSAVFFERFDGIIFILFFGAIRIFSGGYHAETYWGCLVCSNLIFAMIAIGANLLSIHNYIMLMIMAVGIYIFISLQSPNVNKNHPISKIKVIKNKKRLKKSMLISLIALAILGSFSQHYGTVAVYSILAAMFMLRKNRRN